MKFLLTTLNSKYIHINLAIRQLYALNTNEHKNLDWKEFTINEPQENVAQYCSGYDIVAFSCYIWNITQTLSVAQKIKNLNPNIKILLGGPEVSYEWQDVIEKNEIDFIIIGEGEIPFHHFINNYPNILNTPSLVSKTNGATHYNALQQNFDVANYENIKVYQYDNPIELYNKVAYIETSRGCPYKCEFCLASLDNKVRYLPIENIKSTLLYLMQNGRVIKFLDRTFNIKKDFTIDIFKFILANRQPKNVFQFEITADIVHPDIIKYINEKVPEGVFRFEIGIQTVNQKANLEVSRKQNFEKTKDIIKQLQSKIEMHLDLIVGLPLDEYDDIKFSFEEVFALFAPELQLGFLKFLKGTPLRLKHNQHGFVYDVNPPYQIIKSHYLSEKQLHQITIVENILEIYWNKARTINTLKYIATHFSIFDFMFDFGNYFLQKNTFHQFTLENVYTNIYNFVTEHFNNDSIAKQLIAIDYAMQYKVKPKVLFTDELDKIEIKKLIQQYNLPHNNNRFSAIAIDFDYPYFLKTNNIKEFKNNLIIQYNGIDKGIVWNNTTA